MSDNSSSSFSFPFPNFSFSSAINFHGFLHICLRSTVGTFSVIAFTTTSLLLLLPLCVLILYLGHQRWRQQRSSTTMSHSDLITYHMVVMDLTMVVGSTLSCCGAHTDLPQVMTAGIYLVSVNVSGQLLFHTLTCVERYLAVVHPITYLGLRKAKGIRIRNITIGCAWPLSFAQAGLLYVDDQVSAQILNVCIIVFNLTLVSFCSISVLCVLIRPGPGEGGGGGGRQRVDQSKLRAFYTITAILGVLLFRLGGTILTTALCAFTLLGETERCVGWWSGVWSILPSSLVLPLLFLHRAGKLRCFKNNTESGQGSA